MIRIERLALMSYDEIKATGLNTLMRIAKENVFLVVGDGEEKPVWTVPPESESLLKTLELLYQSLDQNTCWVDLNGGNIMKRGNVPVIIDPYAPNRNGWASTHQ